jgi:hypothetical protein
VIWACLHWQHSIISFLHGSSDFKAEGTTWTDSNMGSDQNGEKCMLNGWYIVNVNRETLEIDFGHRCQHEESLCQNGTEKSQQWTKCEEKRNLLRPSAKLLKELVVGDETCVFLYTPRTKHQSLQWKSPEFSRLKEAWMSKSCLFVPLKQSTRHSSFKFWKFYSSAFIKKDQTVIRQIDFASWWCMFPEQHFW